MIKISVTKQEPFRKTQAGGTADAMGSRRMLIDETAERRPLCARKKAPPERIGGAVRKMLPKGGREHRH
jgi:hypothetical protein